MPRLHALHLRCGHSTVEARIHHSSSNGSVCTNTCSICARSRGTTTVNGVWCWARGWGGSDVDRLRRWHWHWHWIWNHLRHLYNPLPGLDLGNVLNVWHRNWVWHRHRLLNILNDLTLDC